jgi:hypothetical protein
MKDASFNFEDLHRYFSNLKTDQVLDEAGQSFDEVLHRVEGLTRCIRKHQRLERMLC